MRRRLSLTGRAARCTASARSMIIWSRMGSFYHAEQQPPTRQSCPVEQ